MEVRTIPNSGWKAVLDLGTNTFQLLVGKKKEAGMEVLFRRKEAVGLGKGGMHRKEILPEPLERGLQVLSYFAEDLKRMGLHPEEAQVLATSAFRNAENASVVLETIRKQTGFQPVVLSGEEEAAFIFEGVKASAVLSNLASSLIVDIGGGSVEFILCQGETSVWKKSIEVGGLRLIEKFPSSDPLAQQEQEALALWLEEALAPVWEATSALEPIPLVGCSGSFDPLIDMRNASQTKWIEDAESLPFHRLQVIEFDALFSKTVHLPLADRLKIPGMIPLRAAMMPVAMILIHLLLRKLQSPTIYTSTWSLKEGVLFSMQP